MPEMPHKLRIALFALWAVGLTAADQAWKDKQFPEWTEDDAKEVLKDSPWSKTVAATLVKPSGKVPQDRSAARRSGASDSANPSNDQPLALTLRWESALPVREAKLKARDVVAPALQDDDHYAIAVYGIPRGMLRDDSKIMADELKKQAVLKREGKRDTKPSSVEILLRDDGPVVLYLFPKSAEFNWRDHRIEFDAQIANLKFSQAFSTDDMTFHGTLAL